MDFGLSPRHRALRQKVREFAESQIAPIAQELDEKHRFPYDIVRELGRLGIMGLPFPRKYGGQGADMLSLVIAVEELARVDSSVAITVAANVCLGGFPIYFFGTEEQKREWLVPLAKGKVLGSMGLTEPQAGSDAGATTTTARLEGDEWIINGSKNFITNSGTDMSAFVTITAVTGQLKGQKEISNIVVPRGTHGYQQEKAYDKLGWCASDTHGLVFDECHVPSKNLLGERGRGFKQLLKVLDGGRVSVAAIGVGLAQGVLETCLGYAAHAQEDGRPISRQQIVQHALADMATKVELARLITYKAAMLQDQGKSFEKHASMAKLYSSEIAMEVADRGVLLFGDFGYLNDYPISRYFRDAKILTIGEGTSEIQRMVIARHLGC